MLAYRINYTHFSVTKTRVICLGQFVLTGWKMQVRSDFATCSVEMCWSLFCLKEQMMVSFTGLLVGTDHSHSFSFPSVVLQKPCFPLSPVLLSVAHKSESFHTRSVYYLIFIRVSLRHQGQLIKQRGAGKKIKQRVVGGRGGWWCLVSPQ